MADSMDVIITATGKTYTEVQDNLAAKLAAFIGTASVSQSVPQVNPTTEISDSGLYTTSRTYTLTPV